MQPSTPKPTVSEKKFDRAKEEAFSNEGAPPPGRVSSLDDNAEVDSGKDGADANQPAVRDIGTGSREATSRQAGAKLPRIAGVT
jgi:hypothetical protein